MEHYLYLYGLQYGLNYVVLRYPNVYGPRQNPNGEAGVVAVFASQMLRGEQKLKETKDPIWIGFLKRESTILLRRAFKVWCQLRFRKIFRS